MSFHTEPDCREVSAVMIRLHSTGQKPIRMAVKAEKADRHLSLMDDEMKYSVSHGDVAIGRLIDVDLWDQKLYLNVGADSVTVTHDGIICKWTTGHDIRERL